MVDKKSNIIVDEDIDLLKVSTKELVKRRDILLKNNTTKELVKKRNMLLKNFGTDELVKKRDRLSKEIIRIENAISKRYDEAYVAMVECEGERQWRN